MSGSPGAAHGPSRPRSLLAERLLAHAERTLTLSLDARRLLVSPELAWTGNVRQLERAVMRGRDRALARDPEAEALLATHFDPRDLGTTAMPNDRRTGSAPAPSPFASIAPRPDTATIASRWQHVQNERCRLDEEEKDLLRASLDAAEGVVSRAARDLGIARTTLSSRLSAFGIRTPKDEGERGSPR